MSAVLLYKDGEETIIVAPSSDFINKIDVLADKLNITNYFIASRSALPDAYFSQSWNLSGSKTNPSITIDLAKAKAFHLSYLNNIKGYKLEKLFKEYQYADFIGDETSKEEITQKKNILTSLVINLDNLNTPEEIKNYSVPELDA